MKKKLFFKLFIFAVIGALVTVTSCKDYDDDISRLDTDLAAAKTSLQNAVTELNTLKTQIAGKADQSAVDAAVAAAKTAAIDAATANATNLLNALKGGYTGTLKDLNDAIVAQAALITVLQGNVATLGTNLDAAEVQIAANKAAIELQQAILDKYLKDGSPDNLMDAINAINAELEALAAEHVITDAAIEALSAKIEAIEASLNVLNFNAKNMVTSVSLYAKTPNIPSTPWTPGISLSFSTAIQKANIFEDGIANAITFVEGAQVQTSASFVVRVSPTNAELTPGMISLQNSKGETYDNIEIVSVEPYNELLTRSTDGSGLWEVTVQLKEYDKDAFNAATTAKVSGATKKVLFAVAVNNTEAAEGEQARKVISEYDMELNYTKDVPVGVLSFKVDKTSVNDINNRFSFTSNESLTPKTQSGTPYAELKWKDSTKPAVEGTTDNTLADNTDDRSTKAVFPAIQGKPMTITIDNDVRGVYVTLDKEANAIESAPSEYNAWKSYTIDNLNTVVEGKEIKITINHSTAINDFIGFRVYAVNHDGTLLDPDGKAFYVSVGNEPDAWPAVNTVVTPPTTDSKAVDVTLPKLAGATKIEWKTDKTEAVTRGPAATDPAFNVYFQEADGAGVFNTVTKVVPSDFSKVKKIVAVPTQDNWLSYKDNKVYKGTLTIKNATGHVLTTMEITMKKELPTAPAGFSVKTNQIGEDGIYRSYLQPDTWTAPNATLGTMPLAQVFNWGTGTIGQFETTFAASQPKAGGGHEDLVITGNGTLSVGKAYVDNTTEHVTKVAYNFGKISTETKDSNGNVIDYKVVIREFPTIFSNIYNNTYSWNWATRAQLNTSLNAVADGLDYTATTGGVYNIPNMPYSTSIEYGATETYDLGYIYGVSSRDSKYNANLDAPYLASLQIVSAKLVSNSNNLDEYFTATLGTTGAALAPAITLAEKSGSTNPTADVPSTLIITAKDMYNNDVEIRLPMTVKKR